MLTVDTGRFLCLLFFVSGLMFGVSAQQPESKEDPSDTSFLYKELGFIEYLHNRGDFRHSNLLLQRLLRNNSVADSSKDQVHYWLGWNYYSMKELDSSAFFLNQVSMRSPFYLKSRFFAAYDQTFLQRYDISKTWISEISTPQALDDSLGGLVKELQAFELAGIALLEGKSEDFERHSLAFTKQYYNLQQEENNLLDYKKLQDAFKPRSPLLAGVFSALLPGSGKLYAGKTGEGIAAFLVVTSLGLVTYENWRKDGPANWKTLLAGGITTIYYTGNIFGSAAAARRHNHAFQQNLQNRILFDLHIPLRNIFN